MSLSILLLPAAIAYVGIKHARGTPEEREGHFVKVSTRMKDTVLLKQALADIGGEVRTSKYVGKNDLMVDWGDEQGVFTLNDDGIWSVHFTFTKNFVRANQIIEDLDRAYGLRVQEQVVRRLISNSAAAGLNLESVERNDEDEVTIVLEIQRDVLHD